LTGASEEDGVYKAVACKSGRMAIEFDLFEKGEKIV
jgi:hypothetical protein